MAGISIKNITKKFDGVKAVDNLSLSFEEEKITSVIGPNGSGKSTLTNVMTGFLPFDEGMVLVGKSNLTKIISHQASRYGLTRTFQEVRLFEQLSVLDNILVVLTERSVVSSLFEKHQQSHLKRAREVLTRVNLWDKKDDLAKNLSYGQRKLLEVARALAMNVKIILFDEPFAGLFPEMIKVVAAIVQELKNEGKTVILIEHNMDLIRQLSDRVVVMDSGQLLAEGEVAEVLARPEVIRAYLGE